MLWASRMASAMASRRARRLFEAQQGRAQRLDAIARLLDEFADEDRRVERRHGGLRTKARRIQQQKHFVAADAGGKKRARALLPAQQRRHRGQAPTATGNHINDATHAQPGAARPACPPQPRPVGFAAR